MTKKKDPVEIKRTVVRLNLAGPITILGCAAQGCSDFVLEGTLDESELVVEKMPPRKDHNQKED
jgi:hypothetical protein